MYAMVTPTCTYRQGITGIDGLQVATHRFINMHVHMHTMQLFIAVQIQQLL